MAALFLPSPSQLGVCCLWQPFLSPSTFSTRMFRLLSSPSCMLIFQVPGNVFHVQRKRSAMVISSYFFILLFLHGQLFSVFLSFPTSQKQVRESTGVRSFTQKQIFSVHFWNFMGTILGTLLGTLKMSTFCH